MTSDSIVVHTCTQGPECSDIDCPHLSCELIRDHAGYCDACFDRETAADRLADEIDRFFEGNE